MKSIRISESGREGVKRAVEDYLQYGQNAQRWLFHRLNSGQTIISYTNKAGDIKRRCIRGTRKGTPDFEVIRRIPGAMGCRVIYLETKATDGKQTPDQVAFEREAVAQGAEYYVVRSLDEMEKVLPYQER